MAHDVFVSHSVKDKAVADAIVARLEGDSVTCWIAPRDVVPGADRCDRVQSHHDPDLFPERGCLASNQTRSRARC